MEYKTPGVYIREVDSGPKPIESVATAVPGFIGLFEFNPEADAIAITGSNSRRSLQGKVIPQLVDSEGNIGKDNKAEAGQEHGVDEIKKQEEQSGHHKKPGREKGNDVDKDVGNESGQEILKAREQIG